MICNEGDAWRVAEINKNLKEVLPVYIKLNNEKVREMLQRQVSLAATFEYSFSGEMIGNLNSVTATSLRSKFFAEKSVG